jgi:hypothetical protein
MLKFKVSGHLYPLMMVWSSNLFFLLVAQRAVGSGGPFFLLKNLYSRLWVAISLNRPYDNVKDRGSWRQKNFFFSLRQVPF